MPLKLTKNKLFFGILTFLLLMNILVIFNLNYFYLQAIFSFIFLITIPGLLIMLMLKIRKINPWEYLVYVIGLSIAFLMFAGLAVNWTLPLFGIDKPLSLMPLLVSFDIFLLTFWTVAYKRNPDLKYRIRSPKLDWTNRVFFIIPIFFPVLSVLGALILNNNGPNILTMIMLGGIAVYVFLVALFRNKLNKNIYPWAILMISIALLLMGWLRGWYVSGVDINVEYHVFQLIKENQYWSMSLFRHVYNACLSVSLLPTILSFFLKVNNHYIFKLIFPLIFSITLLGIFLFLKRYTRHIFAFMAVFFFMSQITFINWADLPIKQEIALLFFTSSLLILFNRNINPTLKKTLFLVFGFSMIVSHYSTTYIVLGLFVFTYLICLVFRETENKKPFSKIYGKLNLKEKGKKSNERKYYLSGILVLLLVVFTFLWYAQLTESSDNLVDFTRKTFKNMGRIFTEEVRAEQTSPFQQFNIFYKPKDLTALLQNYTKDVTLKYKNKPYINLYPSERYKNYKPSVVYYKIVPLKISPDIASKIYLFGEMIKKLVKVFIIIGVFYLLFTQFKREGSDKEYTIMTLVILFFLGGMAALPFVINIDYQIFRLYQQSLIFLSLPAVLGGLVISKSLKKNIRIFTVLTILLLYFLFYSGFILQLVGGANAYMQLNNLGRGYDGWYVHKTEIKSANWLFKNYDNKSFIYAGNHAIDKLWLLNDINENKIMKNVFPSTIDKSAYVYSSYTNAIGKKAFICTRGSRISYNYPTKFLNQNKNLIYNNGGSEIFK